VCIRSSSAGDCFEAATLRRTPYGVLFSHGPFFFEDEKAVTLRDRAVQHSLCNNGLFGKAFHLSNNTNHIVVHVHSNTKTKQPHQTY
jgi:hypothetical protein